MNKRLWTFLLLMLLLLLPSCGVMNKFTDRRVVNVQERPAVDAPPSIAEPGSAAVPQEKVVTMVPDDQPAPPAQPVESTPGASFDEAYREKSVAILRDMLGAPDLELTLKGMESSPNASYHQAVLFVDPQGSRYYINPQTLMPIEFTQEQPVKETGSAKTPDELRAQAEQIADTYSTRFGRLRGQLTYTEGIKGQNNFFRWELPGSDVGGMPAILQIALREDGSLFGYLNSLDLLP